jgi:uncharacterized protein (TIGR03032 family)
MSTTVSASSELSLEPASPSGQKLAFSGDTRGALTISCSTSAGFTALLQKLEISLLVTSARAGQMLALGVQNEQLLLTTVEQHQPQGIAADEKRIAVATHGQVQIYASPSGTVDRGGRRPRGSQQTPPQFRAQRSHHTKGLVSPALGWGREGLWMVNTNLSCLSLLRETGDAVVGWKPSFISQLKDDDRCHLNGLAMQDGRPRYATALGHSDRPLGWRAEPYQSGIVIDVPTGAVIADGLIVPRSPQVHLGRLYLLQSWIGELCLADTRSGTVDCIQAFPGYLAGLGCHRGYAFVGLSRVPDPEIAPPASPTAREDLACGIAVVNLRTGQAEEAINFLTGIDQVSDLAVLPAGTPAVI